MILREMPPIASPSFRRWFYPRWGRENCIVWARTRYVEMPPFCQSLSIKAAWGGHEDYLLEGRRVVVDDDTYLVLNEGRTYGSRVASHAAVTSLAIFFRPGMAAEVERCHRLSEQELLDDPVGAMAPVEFAENPRPHDRSITPVLRFIAAHVQRGLADEAWYEDQLYFLLARMQSLRYGDRAALGRVPARRPATRREIARRLGLCIDFIHAHYDQRIGLTEIAAAAHLSPCHCLRLFKAVHGRTPSTYLRARRLLAAKRLAQESDLSVADIAAQVGFESRSTLHRHLPGSGSRRSKVGPQRR